MRRIKKQTNKQTRRKRRKRKKKEQCRLSLSNKHATK